MSWTLRVSFLWVCLVGVRVWGAEYMVIDLRGGASAESYPVEYLEAVPEGGWTDEHKLTKLVLRRIPAGTFVMGSPEGEPERFVDEVQHEVTLTEDYWMGVFEVTESQWRLVMNSSSTGDPCPVDYTFYSDIRGADIGAGWPVDHRVDEGSFLGRLRSRVAGVEFDLPTEAQWEYACRAGTTTGLNHGKEVVVVGYSPDLEHTEICPNLDEVGRHAGNRDDGHDEWKGRPCGGNLAVVGTYLPNAWGLYDMHGNVEEWCLDWRGPYGTEAVTDPRGPATGWYRVLRGGSWINTARSCRSASRSMGTPDEEEWLITGFRIAAPVVDWSGIYAEAVDTDGYAGVFEWVSGGGANWVVETEETVDGVDAIRSGEVGDDAESWVEAQVTGCGTLSFWWKVSCEERYDSLQLIVDGKTVARLSGECDWAKREVVLEGGAQHTIRWRYFKGRTGSSGRDAAWLDAVTWTPLTLGEALGTPEGIEWSTEGDAEWFAQGAESFDGDGAAQSGRIGNFQYSRLQTTVVGPQVVSFVWKISCEEDYDGCDFLVDGVTESFISGETEWERVQIRVDEGTHVLSWEYWKDGVDDPEMCGNDCAWLDCVEVEALSAITYTQTTPEPVPFAWLDEQGLLAEGTDPEAAAWDDPDEDGFSTWAEFVAGTDPMDESSRFRARIEMNGARPVISWEPDLGDARVYRVEGREELEATSAWENADYTRHHFFRVKVGMNE